MKDNTVSKTAEIVAAMRARHTLYEEPKVFKDEYAIEFCGDRWRRILNSSALRWAVMDVALGAFRSISLEVLGRSRYTEDLLDQAIADGCRQYVILGAGFDTFCLRRPELEDSVDVFEVDFPATQQAKRERILAFRGDLPSNLHLVGVDFMQETLADALQRSAFKTDEPAFFSWLGVTMYLTREATSGTLSSMAAIAAPGSQLVFDYIAPAIGSGEISPRNVRLARFVARRGEPFIGFIRPDDVESLLAASGLTLIENFTPAQQQERYFKDRDDGLKTSRRAFFAHAEV